jgi:hypothetical protein
MSEKKNHPRPDLNVNFIKSKHLSRFRTNREKNRKLTNDLQQYILQSYENITHHLFESIHDIAKNDLQLTTIHYLFKGPFFMKMMENYGLQLFTKGFSYGIQQAANMLDSTYKEEIALLVESLLADISSESQKYFSQAETKCFTVTGYKAFELGVEAGRVLYKESCFRIK